MPGAVLDAVIPGPQGKFLFPVLQPGAAAGEARVHSVPRDRVGLLVAGGIRAGGDTSDSSPSSAAGAAVGRAQWRRRDLRGREFGDFGRAPLLSSLPN